MFIYEFLYRGPTAENDGKSAWHVVLAEYVTVFGEQKLQTLGPMTPAQAEARGVSVSDVLTEIVANATAEADALRETVATLESEKEALTGERDRAVALAEASARHIQALTAETKTATKSAAKKG